MILGYGCRQDGGLIGSIAGCTKSNMTTIAIWEISSDNISGTSRMINFVFGTSGVFRVGGSSGAICSLIESKMAAMACFYMT